MIHVVFFADKGSTENSSEEGSPVKGTSKPVKITKVNSIKDTFNQGPHVYLLFL